MPTVSEHLREAKEHRLDFGLLQILRLVLKNRQKKIDEDLILAKERKIGL